MSDQDTSSAENIAKPPPDADNEKQPPTSPPNDASDSDKNEEWDAENFKMSTRSWLVFLMLSVLTLMVALDGTSISVALPVSIAWKGSDGWC